MSVGSSALALLQIYYGGISGDDDGGSGVRLWVGGNVRRGIVRRFFQAPRWRGRCRAPAILPSPFS